MVCARLQHLHRPGRSWRRCGRMPACTGCCSCGGRQRAELLSTYLCGELVQASCCRPGRCTGVRRARGHGSQWRAVLAEQGAHARPQVQPITPSVGCEGRVVGVLQASPRSSTREEAGCDGCQAQAPHACVHRASIGRQNVVSSDISMQMYTAVYM